MPAIKPGEEWGEACDASPDVEVEGSDRDLALVVAGHPGALVRFVPGPSSQLAGAVGLRTGEPRGWAVPMDALALDDGRVAVNMIVIGTPPDRIGWRPRPFALGGTHTGTPVLSAVVANGQFRHGHDLVPRGHPGDARAEFQLYRIRRAERRQFRHRVSHGAHIPHPGITQTRVRSLTIHTTHKVPLELDSTRSGATQHLTITVVPHAYKLLL